MLDIDGRTDRCMDRLIYSVFYGYGIIKVTGFEMTWRSVTIHFKATFTSERTLLLASWTAWLETLDKQSLKRTKSLNHPLSSSEKSISYLTRDIIYFIRYYKSYNFYYYFYKVNI